MSLDPQGRRALDLGDSDRSVFILNGPNLNYLGRREPAVYGTATLADVETLCRETAAAHGLTIDFRQTNREGELVEWLHEADRAACAAVLNPAGYGHTSIAILDALLSITIPVVECHLSNLAKREEWRHTTRTAAGARGVIFGFGPLSYALAIQAVASLVRQ